MLGRANCSHSASSKAKVISATMKMSQEMPSQDLMENVLDKPLRLLQGTPNMYDKVKDKFKCIVLFRRETITAKSTFVDTVQVKWNWSVDDPKEETDTHEKNQDQNEIQINIVGHNKSEV